LGSPDNGPDKDSIENKCPLFYICRKLQIKQREYTNNLGWTLEGLAVLTLEGLAVPALEGLAVPAIEGFVYL
jgi:CobQ-like glutamine amidotransferase family enzyme